MNEPVRILLLELPQLLRGIFEHAIHVHSDCELLNEARTVSQILAKPELAPNAVIVGLSAAQDATLVCSLFARWPGARVLTVLPAAEDAVMYELRPHERPLGKVSPAEIIDTLRNVVQRAGLSYANKAIDDADLR